MSDKLYAAIDKATSAMAYASGLLKANRKDEKFQASSEELHKARIKLQDARKTHEDEFNRLKAENKQLKKRVLSIKSHGRGTDANA